MKSLGFFISLLLHLLFLLLIITIRFPVPDIVIPPQVIQIVPMSPPPAASRPLSEPRLVFVRPFVLKGGPAGSAVEPAAGNGTARAKASRREPALLPPVPPAERPTDPSVAGTSALATQRTGPSPEGEKGLKLTVDLDRISQRLYKRNTAEKRSEPSGFIADKAGEGLPFGEPLAGGGGGGVSPGGGDGTASNALGGNAFFDSRGYDITPWAKRMVYRVKKNWIFPPLTGYGVKGIVGIYVLIERNGSIRKIFVRKASGIRPFDQAAFNAIELSAPLLPLPDDFPYDDLPAYLLFYYN